MEWPYHTVLTPSAKDKTFRVTCSIISSQELQPCQLTTHKSVSKLAQLESKEFTLPKSGVKSSNRLLSWKRKILLLSTQLLQKRETRNLKLKKTWTNKNYVRLSSPKHAGGYSWIWTRFVKTSSAAASRVHSRGKGSESPTHGPSTALIFSVASLKGYGKALSLLVAHGLERHKASKIIHSLSFSSNHWSVQHLCWVFFNCTSRTFLKMAVWAPMAVTARVATFSWWGIESVVKSSNSGRGMSTTFAVSRTCVIFCATKSSGWEPSMLFAQKCVVSCENGWKEVIGVRRCLPRRLVLYSMLAYWIGRLHQLYHMVKYG